MDSDLLPTTRRALRHRLATAQADGRVPSMVAAVVRDGEQVWWGARSSVDGHAPDEDVQYRIGSITKTFTAVLVLRLRAEGLLSLADRLDRHLPELPGTVGEVTIAQLLTHTAGLAAEQPGPWIAGTPRTLHSELADLLQQPPLVHPAGRVHHYSNVGYALLGAVVERHRGKPWDEVLEAEVLQPLGMTRTTRTAQAPAAGGWAVHPWADLMCAELAEDSGLMAPAGQYWSTLADLVRWANFLAVGDEKVLDAGALAEMRRTGTAAAGGSGYGLGLELSHGHGLFFAGHSGSVPGFRAALLLAPAEGLAGVALTNSSTYPGGLDTVVKDLLRIVHTHEPRIPEPWRPLPEADPELLALTGHWYWGTTAFTLHLRADRSLELAAATGKPTTLQPEPDGAWTAVSGPWNGETLRLQRDGTGTVTHLDLGAFLLTREPYPGDGPTPGGAHPDGWIGLP